MTIKIKEMKNGGICPSGHKCFYQVIEDDKVYCMICYALGFVHQIEKVKDMVVESEFGKQVV